MQIVAVELHERLPRRSCDQILPKFKFKFSRCLWSGGVRDACCKHLASHSHVSSEAALPERQTACCGERVVFTHQWCMQGFDEQSSNYKLEANPSRG